ncbi:hypothetical protein HHI36_008675 [Cryptolaemus montrouzieri]|uniref:Uncharacterized protein n=1 Tax=Cryptolaemus montrouzieri TaxID=559131 RepID=A0ABD2MT17_9CUCU
MARENAVERTKASQKPSAVREDYKFPKNTVKQVRKNSLGETTTLNRFDFLESEIIDKTTWTNMIKRTRELKTEYKKAKVLQMELTQKTTREELSWRTKIEFFIDELKSEEKLGIIIKRVTIEQKEEEISSDSEELGFPVTKVSRRSRDARHH